MIKHRFVSIRRNGKPHSITYILQFCMSEHGATEREHIDVIQSACEHYGEVEHVKKEIWGRDDYATQVCNYIAHALCYN